MSAMFQRKPPSGANTPNSQFPSDTESKKKLLHYVYEYLYHVGAKQTADSFVKEMGLPDGITAGESPGFLHSWWCVFWDLYCAAPERRDNLEHSQEAKMFHDFAGSSGMGLVNGMPGQASPIAHGPGVGMSRYAPPQTMMGPRGEMYPCSTSAGMPPQQFMGRASAGPGVAGPQRLHASRMGMPPHGPGQPPPGMQPGHAQQMHMQQFGNMGASGLRPPPPGSQMQGRPPWTPTSSGMPYNAPSPGGGAFASQGMPMANGGVHGQQPIMSPHNMPPHPQFGHDRFGMMGGAGHPGAGPGPGVVGGMPHSNQAQHPAHSQHQPAPAPNFPQMAGDNNMLEQHQQHSALNGETAPSSAAHTPNNMQHLGMDTLKSSPGSAHGGLNNGGTPVGGQGSMAGPASVGNTQAGTPQPASTPQPATGNSSANTPLPNASGPPSVPANNTQAPGSVGAGRSSVPPNPQPDQMDCSSDQSEIAKIKAAMMEETRKFEHKNDAEAGDYF